tara:strand:+ start:447 stop:713 length:267 start_codon:yes stop_codon:yes gene_type:complete
MNAPVTFAVTLDRLPMRQPAKISAIDWESMSENEGARLRALGIDEGVSVEKLHKGMFGFNDPIALKVGRMMIALRKSHASAISVVIPA